MENRMTLGEFIAKRRRSLRLTQESLAEEMHVSKSAIAKWETNGGIPDRDNLKNLATKLAVSLEDLYRIIDCKDIDENDFDINITREIITVLESYGYIVIKPNNKEET